MLCGSSVAGLLRTRAQHTVEWHMATSCGLHRPGRHSKLPKRRGRGQPDACFLAAGITPLAAAVHLIAWRIPCEPGRITLIGRLTRRNAPMLREVSRGLVVCARAGEQPGRAQAGHTTRGPHRAHHLAWACLGQVDVRECSAAHMGSLVVGNTISRQQAMGRFLFFYENER